MHNTGLEILIVSWYYYPEPTPRAFRSHELTKEFCRQGYKVKLVLPNKETFRRAPYKHENLTNIYVGDNICDNPKTLNLKKETSNVRKRSLFRRILPDVIKNPIKQYREFHANYFYPIRNKQYIKDLYNYLIDETTVYDIIISIGLPVETHVATAKAIRKNKNLQKATKTYADYGDPFSQRQGQKIFFAYYLVDLFIAQTFKYISVPTSIAINSYTSFISKKRLKVIPQGFNMDEYEWIKYKSNKIPTFAYAGVFYEEIRNPSCFFDYLLTLSDDFKFIIYTINFSRDTKKIIEKYLGKIGSRLIVKYNMDRKEIIKELSRMDFLVNFENITDNQIPSKLIDYAIARRPICSISTSKFQSKLFDSFLDGDYKNQINIDIEDYDIKRVINQILN